MEDRRIGLEKVRDRFGLLVVYLFGSRAHDGLRLLEGNPVEKAASDLDVGVVFAGAGPEPLRLGELQLALEDVFAPLRVDLVPLQKVDPLFQFRAIDGHRVTASDMTRVNFFELGVMRLAAELLPVQRQLERELFGVSTS